MYCISFFCGEMQVQCNAFQFEGERKKRGRQWKSLRRWKPGIWRAHNDDDHDDYDDHDLDGNDDLVHDDGDLDHNDDDHDPSNQLWPQFKDFHFVMSGQFCTLAMFYTNYQSETPDDADCRWVQQTYYLMVVMDGCID